MNRNTLLAILLATLVIAVSGNYNIASGADAAAGKPVYEGKCLMCHGPAGGGDGPLGAALKPKPADFKAEGFLAGKSDADLTKVIKEGKGGIMPPFATLKDEEIANIIAYIRTFVPAKK